MEPDNTLIEETRTEITVRRTSDRVRRRMIILGAVVATMWLLELVDVFLFQQRLNALGVRPRTTEGLWGILFMPLLHGNLAHVAANTLPFLILGWLVIMRRLGDFLVVTAITMIVSGAGVWLFAAPTRSASALVVSSSAISAISSSAVTSTAAPLHRYRRPRPLIFWETTAGCNLACIHCRRITVADQLMPQDLTTAEVVDMIDQIAAFGRPIFVLSGGEPLFRPDIFDIARTPPTPG
jgi:hypothetical protein